MPTGPDNCSATLSDFLHLDGFSTPECMLCVQKNYDDVVEVNAVFGVAE